MLLFLAAFSRVDLANLTWVGAVWSREVDSWSIQSYRLLAGSLLVLVFYDFLWVFANFDYMVFAVHEDPKVSLHRFCFVMSFFGFTMKVLIFIMMVKNFINFKNQQLNNLLQGSS